MQMVARTSDNRISIGKNFRSCNNKPKIIRWNLKGKTGESSKDNRKLIAKTNKKKNELHKYRMGEAICSMKGPGEHMGLQGHGEAQGVLQ